MLARPPIRLNYGCATAGRRPSCDELRRSDAERRYRWTNRALDPDCLFRAARSNRRFVYIEPMAVKATSQEHAPILGWARVRFTLGVSASFGLLLSLGAEAPTLVMVTRAIAVGLAAMLAFGLFERWPRRLPKWLPRSVVQLIGVVLAVPIVAVFAYLLSAGGPPQLENGEHQSTDLGKLILAGVLFAPWIAVGAMLKQRDAFAREQALAFELERSQLERNALETRLHVLQAQVEPHFLFNTLANVQALVDAGSPHASKVLASLIAYLRAAVPRMHDTATTLGEEAELVRAYLGLMQMRMPDRLHFGVHVDPATHKVRCPPMTLLTLVENAVRHGIDPSEQGGRIDVDVWLRDERCLARISDTGVGLKATGQRLGTGLTTLRERLQLAFGNEAQLRLTEVEPHGVCAELTFPARPRAA
jgi:hypothetical protein